MTVVMTSLPLAHVFQCLFTFALVSASRWLAEIWQVSRRGAAEELEVEFKFQRPSCKLAGYGIDSVKSRIQDCLGYMLWLPIIQSCFTLGTRDFSCLASSFGLYGDLCKAIDLSARGLYRNILLRAPFGTQGRLAIPFVHIFIIKGRYSILKQSFATLHRSCARYNFFVFSRTLTSVRAKRACHPRFFLYILPPYDIWMENRRSVNSLWIQGCSEC